MATNDDELKGKPEIPTSELSRISNAFGYSYSGLITAFRQEAAFHSECIMFVISIPLAWIIAATTLQLILLLASIILVMAVELLNSALEEVCDLITTDYHPAIKKAKDYGSAAVMLTLIMAALLWAVIAWMKLFAG